MQRSLWPNPQHQALLQTCCSQSCSSGGWLHTEIEKSDRGFLKKRSEREHTLNDYIHWHKLLYTDVNICAIYVTFGVSEFSTEELWQLAIFNTKACYCHLVCRQHEAWFNKAEFLQFPVSKPPTAFPGTLTYMWDSYFSLWYITKSFRTEMAVFPSKFIHSTEKQLTMPSKTEKKNKYNKYSSSGPVT